MDFRFGDGVMLFGVALVFMASFFEPALPGEPGNTTAYVVGFILLGATFMLGGLRLSRRTYSNYELRERALSKLSPEELDALMQGSEENDEMIVEVRVE